MHECNAPVRIHRIYITALSSVGLHFASVSLSLSLLACIEVVVYLYESARAVFEPYSWLSTRHAMIWYNIDVQYIVDSIGLVLQHQRLLPKHGIPNYSVARDSVADTAKAINIQLCPWQGLSRTLERSSIADARWLWPTDVRTCVYTARTAPHRRGTPVLISPTLHDTHHIIMSWYQ